MDMQEVGVEDLDARLLVKVSELYHVEGLNQVQIARQLGVSQSKVSRSLREARESGVVEVVIHYPTQFSLELERQLESEFGLHEALVINADGLVGNQVHSVVTRAAADYVVRVLQPGDVLGVSGGEALTRVAQVIPAGAITGVSVVQLGGALIYPGRGPAYPSPEVALQLAQKLGSIDRLVLIPVPSLLGNGRIRDALLSDDGVRHAMTLIASCRVALVGIGALDPLSRYPGSLAFTEGEVMELRMHGAVGEICTRFFDIHGKPCSTSLDQRLVALDLNQMRSVPLVIGVAYGKSKAAAILGALRGGYLKTLVTDDGTAAEVLALARSVTVGV